MGRVATRLVTPIYVKTRDDMPWPREPVFYLLAGDGLFLCRNHGLFRSCVPARGWPAELARQSTLLELRSPRVPRNLLEQIVGFFAEVGQVHGAEAAVLLLWDERLGRIRPFVPEQRATIYRGWQGRQYPIGVRYDLPERLPDGCLLLGDVHSHVDGAAYASWVDQTDESFRPGLHVVIGRVHEEPPEFHIDATIDGVRFSVASDLVLEGYGERSPAFPREWLDAVEVDVQTSSYYA